MNSRTTKRFRQMLAKLPSNIRQQAKGAYRLFRENSHHPSLQFKKVHDTEPIYAVRINQDLRKRDLGRKRPLRILRARP